MNANVKTLTLGQPAVYLWSALFVAANVLFPQLCHLVPWGGKALLPIMLFTLVAAVRFGVGCALLTAVASPLVSTLLFGMPSGMMLGAVLAKSAVIALVFGLWKETHRAFTLPAIVLLVLFCQAFCFLTEGGLMFGWETSWADLLISWPGMSLQVLAGWLVIRYWK